MPAVDPTKPPKGWATYPSSGASFSPWVDVRVCTSPGVHSYAKKVFARTSTGWSEVWNNRPVAVTGSASSSAYNSITLTGTVDPNNFSTTPRFYYKKSTDSAYTVGAALTVITGDTVQSVGSVTITGLVENTTYNYYLSATSTAGTSDTLTISSVTTQVDCRQLGLDNGWSGTTVITYPPCGCSGSYELSTTTWVKPGCTSYPTSSQKACVGDCAADNTTCFEKSAAKTTTTTNPCGCSGNQTGTYYTWNPKLGTGCAAYDTAVTWDGPCIGNCSTADTDCYTSSALSCDGCGSGTSYVTKPGQGCTATTTGGCGTWDFYPGYSYLGIEYNFLGDGVNWYAIQELNSGVGGWTPDNNFHGNGCTESDYALWYLYTCSLGNTPNSRIGRKEVNTGRCGTFA